MAGIINSALTNTAPFGALARNGGVKTPGAHPNTSTVDPTRISSRPPADGAIATPWATATAPTGDAQAAVTAATATDATAPGRHAVAREAAIQSGRPDRFDPKPAKASTPGANGNPATKAPTTPSTPAATATPSQAAPTPAGSITLAPASVTNATANGMGYNASQVGAVGYSAEDIAAPAPMKVAANQTMQGQLAGILASNSPLMQQAYNDAMVSMNDRGLINSSTAVGAAQKAVYAAALPIAQNDSGVYQNTALTNFQAATQNAQLNAASANQAAQFGANAQNAAGIQNATSQNAAAQFGANAQNVANLQAAQLAAQKEIAAANNATALRQTQLSTQTQQAIAQLSADTQLATAKMSSDTQIQVSAAHDANAVLLQNSGAATSMFNQYLTNVGNIDANPNMDMDAKTAAIKTQTDIFNTAIKGLTAASPGVPNVSSLLDFSKPASTAAATGSSADSETNSGSVGHGAADGSS